ncbi:MAG: T9SS type A sorting domain-containing protein [Bacteroidota bacterium]
MKRLYFSFLSLLFVGAFGYAQTSNVTFTVDMTNEMADPDSVFLNGAFTGWNDTLMSDNSDGTYSITFELTEGDTFEYKFKNGVNGWEDIPGTDCTSGGFGNNRLLVVPADDTTELYCFNSCSSTCPDLTADITFTVDMSNEMADPDSVFINGAFTGWTDSLMMDNGDGTYSLTFADLDIGEEYEYKFKNGVNGWEDIPGEICTAGGFGNNRLLVVAGDATEAYCFGSCFACGDVAVTLHVDMSNETVDPEGVFVAGDFTGWDNHPMTNNGDGTWSTTVGATPLDTVAYKFKNGVDGWEEITDSTCTDGTFGNNRLLVIDTMDMDVDLVCFGSCSACPAQIYPITFSVDMSNETVDPDGVRLAGTITGWGDSLMVDNGDGTWSVTFNLNAGDTIFYKFKNGPGGWEGFDGPCTIGNDNNRFLVVPSDSTVLDTVCFQSCFACGLVSVTLTVDMQFETVEPEGVFLAGEYNGWSDGPMWDNGDGTWTGGFGAMPGDTLEYKFKNGPNGWESFDGDCLIGGNGSNRFIAANNDTTAATVCFNMCEQCIILDTIDLTFRVDMTEETVDPAGVFIAGNFNNFDELPMMNMGDSIWAITLQFAPGDTLEYKFLNGPMGFEVIAETSCTTNDGFANNRRTVAPNFHTVLDAVCFSKCGVCFDPTSVSTAALSQSCMNANGTVTIVFDESQNCDSAPGDLAGLAEIGFHSSGNMWDDVIDWDAATAATATNDGNDVFSVTIDPADYYGINIDDIERIMMVFNQGPAVADPDDAWDSEGKDQDLDEDGSCDDMRLFLADLPMCSFDPTTTTSPALKTAGSCYDPMNELVKIRFDDAQNCANAPGELAGMTEVGFHSGADSFMDGVDWNAPGAQTAVNDGTDVFEVTIDPVSYYAGVNSFSDLENIYMVFNQGPSDPDNPWDSEGKDEDADGNCVDLRLIISDLPTCDLTNTIDRELENSLVAIPNPFDSRTVVTFSNPNLTSYDVTLLSLTGQQMRTFRNVNGTTLEIDRNGMPSGMYFLNFRNEEGKIATLKLVVK